MNTGQQINRKNMKTENTELVKNGELQDLVVNSGLELTKAEDHAKAFHPSLAELSELSRPLAKLDRENPTKEHAKIARENRLKIVKVRTGAKEIKDERKKILLIEGNFIQKAFNFIESACELTEAEYEAIEKHEANLEKKRKAELAESRKEKLLPFNVDTTYLPLSEMSEDVFTELLCNSELLHNAKIAKAEREEAERLESERLAEEERVAKEESARIENERIRKENEALKAEQERKETELKAERERIATEAAERERLAQIEAEKQAKINAKLKAENDRIAAELKARQEAEERALEEEKKRIAQIEADKKAKAKAAATAPDKVKVKELFESVKAINIPVFESKEGKDLGDKVSEALDIVRKLIIQESKKLL